ncbi:MAG: TraR/DksA C4-type zinc finger protein [Myxococcales bacterium]|nr:TraR/DksA C4-type zinc finger protein [Myxococcales bacterium]MCB9525833.1 TraR/DksA C4-type zinc finger protein [Myxococcales bacterium]
MEPTELEAFAARLKAMREELLDQGPHRADPTRTDLNGRRDEDAEPLTEMLQSIASSRNRNLSKVLAAIDRSLARVDEDPDLVGLCLQCEEPIAPKRLALMPYAEYCVRCQAANEGPVKPTSRKHLTDFE